MRFIKTHTIPEESGYKDHLQLLLKLMTLSSTSKTRLFKLEGLRPQLLLLNNKLPRLLASVRMRLKIRQTMLRPRKLLPVLEMPELSKLLVELIIIHTQAFIFKSKITRPTSHSKSGENLLLLPLPNNKLMRLKKRVKLRLQTLKRLLILPERKIELQRSTELT